MSTMRKLLVAAVSLTAIEWTRAGVVLTQDISRAEEVTHFDNPIGQHTLAGTLVRTNHDFGTTLLFDQNSLNGVDVVYLSPYALSTGDFLSSDELDALEDFVDDGGRLILAGDIQNWARSMNTVAQRFGVTYDEGFGTTDVLPILDHDNPITNGPAGQVNNWQPGLAGAGVLSSDPDFVTLSEGALPGSASLAYLQPNPTAGRLGEVVFLTDFNAFFNTKMGDHDHGVLWNNLFAIPEPSTITLLGVALIGLYRRR